MKPLLGGTTPTPPAPHQRENRYNKGKDVELWEIVGYYIGDRSGESAKALWQSLPAVYR